jgi:hypothetical protein
MPGRISFWWWQPRSRGGLAGLLLVRQRLDPVADDLGLGRVGRVDDRALRAVEVAAVQTQVAVWSPALGTTRTGLGASDFETS